MQYTFTPAFPTPQHHRAAELARSFFADRPGVAAVLLMGSCARGKASPDSCLDILILGRPEEIDHRRPELEQAWQEHYTTHPAYQEMQQVGVYAHVDLDIINGVFQPGYHGWTSGADEFELEVGNTLAYSVPLWEGGSYYQELRARWLPYYDETLRQERLAMVLRYLWNNLSHIPLFAPRGLYFQCFKRFYHAFEEFLQALYISRRVYPIAYDKWVKEGIVDILGLPDLYTQLPGLLEIDEFESQEIVQKSRALGELVRTYIKD